MKNKYHAFCDGGCYTRKDGSTTPSYFSFKIFNQGSSKPLYAIDKFYLRSLIPTQYQHARDRKGQLGNVINIVNNNSLFVPVNCSIFNNKGRETNNISEYAALYYCLSKLFSLIQPGPQIEMFSDSQLIVNQVNDLWMCKQDHLKPWLFATNQLKNQMNVVLTHTPRKNIVKILGH